MFKSMMYVNEKVISAYAENIIDLLIESKEKFLDEIDESDNIHISGFNFINKHCYMMHIYDPHMTIEEGGGKVKIYVKEV